MSALTRLAPFGRVGGRLLRGCRARAAGDGGVRHAGGGVHIPPKYREFPQLTRNQVIQGEFLSSLMWFWILWRFWHDSDAVLLDSQSSAQCLAVDLCICFHQLLDEGSVMMIRVVTNLITVEDPSQWTDEELGILPDEEE